VAIALAVVSGLLWVLEHRDNATLMLCVLGVGVATSIYFELGLMHSTAPAEYAELIRWFHIPTFLIMTGQVMFVHYYLRTGRPWLLWSFILARAVILVVNFSVHPNFNFSEIVSLGHASLFGDQVSVIGVAVTRIPWQFFAAASQCASIAYTFDAASQKWFKGDRDSRHRALVVTCCLAAPLVFNAAYGQLVAFGVLHGPFLGLPIAHGALLIMAAELTREAISYRRARLDVAELRSELSQLERVSLLGQLGAALSHELSQPLTSTAANVEAGLRHLENERPDHQELRSLLDDIGSDQRRASEIIHRMRQLLKRRTIELQEINVAEVLEDALGLVRSAAISSHVSVRQVMEAGLPKVYGDRVHLTQVLLNLLVNSIHALQSRPLEARHIVIEVCADDAKGEIEIAVQDSGPGIPTSLADELFRPFYTTKAEGTGIGLALSRTIIEAHGGRLRCDNSAEGGAIFRFTLRAVENSPARRYLAPIATDEPTTA
jgi:signal transduction histidine kinase